MLLLWIICSIGEFIDLQEEIDDVDMEEPYCEAKYSASVSTFDHLPSIADKDKLVYSSEDVLREVSFVSTFTPCYSYWGSLCSKGISRSGVTRRPSSHQISIVCRMLYNVCCWMHQQHSVFNSVTR